MLDKISNYKIVRLIGAGGMGEVYEGIHEQIQRRAAIKVLRAAFAENQEVVHRFLNEARAVNIISHPSLVSIYEFGQASDKSPYIIMEYLDGETLRQRLTRVGRIPPVAAMNIARQIASALAAAHAKQIVHRDLKPVNVMIIPDSDMAEGERVKVLDFGIAKLRGDGQNEGLTRTGTSMGTPRYMSPEQCKSARDVTDKSDVYTLGLMFYEMLCGASPYAEIKSEVMLMGAQIGQPPPPLSEKGTEASAELCALVHRMLEKQPDARPSAAELATILKRMTGGAASSTFPVGPGQAAVSGEHSGPIAAGSPAPAPAAAAAPAPEPPAPTTGGMPQGGRYLIAIAGGTLGLGLIGLILVLRSVLHPPAPPPPPPAVRWHIVSDPNGADLVDQSGALIGHTPFERTQPKAAGQATFTLRKSGYTEQKLTLDLGKDVDSSVTLPPVAPPPADDAEEKPAATKKKGGKNKKRGGRGK